MNTVSDFIRKIDGAYVLDIRSPTGYRSGHICGAIPIFTPLPPLSRVQQYNLKTRINNFLWDNDVKKSDKIFLYCKKGKRAGMARNYLKSIGYHNVEVLGGVDVDPLKKIIKQGRQTIFC